MAYLVKKVFTDRSRGGMTAVYVFNAVGCIVSALVLLAWGGLDGASLFTVLLGALFGITVSPQGAFVTQAMQIGPMSYTVVITTCSTVFTALSGFFFFHESIGIFQIVGIVFMLSSFVFANEKKKDEKKGSLKWFVFSILAFIGSGGIGFMQKIHQTSAHKGEINAFLFVAFICSLIYSRIRARKTFKELEFGKKQIIFALVCGLCVYTMNALNLKLSGLLPSQLFFPLVNGTTIVLSSLFSVILFKEKITRKQLIGLIGGIACLIAICIVK
jgi:drug/metabolite transporter (DMT)-like permease